MIQNEDNTEYLLGSQVNVDRLNKSIVQIREGNTFAVEIDLDEIPVTVNKMEH